MKFNKIILSIALFCGAINFSFASGECDNENSKNCTDFVNLYCSHLEGKSFDTCKSEIVLFYKSGKLTTDGKDHLDELLGNYSTKRVSSAIKFEDFNSGRKLVYVVEGGWFDIVKINEYTFAINYPVWDEEKDDYDYTKVDSQQCFAYDTNRKALTFLKECGSDEIDYSMPKSKVYK